MRVDTPVASVTVIREADIRETFCGVSLGRDSGGTQRYDVYTVPDGHAVQVPRDPTKRLFLGPTTLVKPTDFSKKKNPEKDFVKNVAKRAFHLGGVSAHGFFGGRRLFTREVQASYTDITRK